MDIVLAAATQAERTRPTVDDIADAWIDQNDRHERYYFQNVQHGIRTPEDGLIWKRIQQRGPGWRQNGSYGQAVSLLEKEAQTAKRQSEY